MFASRKIFLSWLLLLLSTILIGSAAFAHKGGLHVAAMERSPLSYQHVEPELVGNDVDVTGPLEVKVVEDPLIHRRRGEVPLDQVRSGRLCNHQWCKNQKHKRQRNLF